MAIKTLRYAMLLAAVWTAILGGNASAEETILDGLNRGELKSYDLVQFRDEIFGVVDGVGLFGCVIADPTSSVVVGAYWNSFSEDNGISPYDLARDPYYLLNCNSIEHSPPVQQMLESMSRVVSSRSDGGWLHYQALLRKTDAGFTYAGRLYVKASPISEGQLIEQDWGKVQTSENGYVWSMPFEESPRGLRGFDLVTGEDRARGIFRSGP